MAEDYVFSIAGFQRKLDSHYVEGKRPPLLEAWCGSTGPVSPEDSAVRFVNAFRLLKERDERQSDPTK